VQDAAHRLSRALDLGAWIRLEIGPMELKFRRSRHRRLAHLFSTGAREDGVTPGGIGDISIYDGDFEPVAERSFAAGCA